MTLWRNEKAKRPMCAPCLLRACPALCFVAFSRPDGSGTQRVRVKTRSTRLQERLLVSGMTVCRTRPGSTRWSWAPNIAFRDAIFTPQWRKNMAVVTTCNNVTSITRYFQRFSKIDAGGQSSSLTKLVAPLSAWQLKIEQCIVGN